jgi:hypothetical protein
LNHFGCPQVYLDQLHSGFSFFVPIFFSIIYVVTFLLNVGYIVEERANKTKVNKELSLLIRCNKSVTYFLVTFFFYESMFITTEQEKKESYITLPLLWGTDLDELKLIKSLGIFKNFWSSYLGE